MAVDDKWYKIDKDTGKRVRSAKYGRGNRWLARWYDAAGEQREKSFATKPEAERHSAKMTTDLANGTYIDPKAGKIKFQEMADLWRESQPHQAGTAELAERQLRLHANPFFGNRELSELRLSHGQTWVRKLEAGDDEREPLSLSTIEVIVGKVGAVLNYAVADGRISRNPFATVTVTKSLGKKISPPIRAHVDALYAAMPAKLKALITVGSGLGTRRGEAFGLEVDQLDFDLDVVDIRQQLIEIAGCAPYLKLPKGEKTREVPMPGVVKRELQRHIKEHPPAKVWIEDRRNPSKPVWRWAELVFTTETGRPVRPSHFAQVTWKRARAIANLPTEITFHWLRHFYASALIRFGESVKVVQVRMGHATAQVTMEIYGHLWPDSDSRTRDAIDDMLGEKLAPARHEKVARRTIVRRPHVGRMWATRPRARSKSR